MTTKLDRRLSTVSALALGLTLACGAGEAGDPDVPRPFGGGKADEGDAPECAQLAPVERPESRPFGALAAPIWPVEDRLPVALLVTSVDDPGWGGLWLVDPLDRRIVAAYEGSFYEAGEAYVGLAKELATRLVPVEGDVATLDFVRGGAGIKVRRPPPPPPPVPGGDDPFASWLLETTMAFATSGDHGDDPGATTVYDGESFDLPRLERLEEVDFNLPLHAGFEVRTAEVLMITFADEPDRVDVFVVDVEAGVVLRQLTGSASAFGRTLVVSQAKQLYERLWTDTADEDDPLGLLTPVIAGIKVRRPPPPPPPVPGGGELAPWAKWVVVLAARTADARRRCRY